MLFRSQVFTGPGRCVICHSGGLFADDQFHNEGLRPIAEDNGRQAVTGNPADAGRFKTPSLRNIALTAPYMHDGRFETLAEVIEFYNAEVEPHPNLDRRLQGPDGQPRRLNLSDQEKAALAG